MIFLILVALLLIFVHSLIYQLWRRADVLFAGLPTYSRLPILGHLHHFIGGHHVLFKILCDVTEIVEEKDLPFYINVGPFPLLCTQDPDDLRAITNTFAGKAYFYDFGRFWLGDGLVTATVPIWRQRIKKLGSAFNNSVVGSYQEIFNMQAVICLEELKGEAGREPFDVLEKYIVPSSLATICRTAMGMSETDKETEFALSAYRHALNRVLELLIQRGLNVFLHPEFVYRLTPWHRELLKCLTVLHKVSDIAMANKRKERDEMKTSGCMGKGPKFRSYLDILLDLKETDPSFTKKQIIEEVDTVIGAGHETNASTISYCLLMLGSHPDVQDKLYAEIKSIFGDNILPLTKEDLSQMSYCEAVICETLRLYPPIPMVMRCADNDLQIKSCTIPKGTTCVINIRGMGRSRRRWGEDATTFRPERWLEPGFTPPAGSYIPFSYGKRACIGQKYAMEMMKTYLAYIVRDLKMESEAEKLQFKLDVGLRPIAGHYLKVQLRDK